MYDLFPLEPALIPKGFSYHENFISQQEEERLIKIVSSLELHTFLFRGYEAKRKLASYGFDYHFDSRTISPGTPVPTELEFLMRKVASFIKLPSSEFQEVLVTEYPPGSVINWHRDAPPFELIAGISLASDCKFKFRPYEKSKQGRGSIRSFNVQRRSLYVMKDEAREEWEHSIDKVKYIRYSITLRTLRK